MSCSPPYWIHCVRTLAYLLDNISIMFRYIFNIYVLILARRLSQNCPQTATPFAPKRSQKANFNCLWFLLDLRSRLAPMLLISLCFRIAFPGAFCANVALVSPLLAFNRFASHRQCHWGAAVTPRVYNLISCGNHFGIDVSTYAVIDKTLKSITFTTLCKFFFFSPSST